MIKKYNQFLNENKQVPGPHDKKEKVNENIETNDNPYYDSDEFDDKEDLEPIGVDNLSCEAMHGLVCIFSPLESDMVEGWNNDEKVKKFIEEKRLFLSELSYDEWEIYGIKGDRQVRNYIMKNYSW